MKLRSARLCFTFIVILLSSANARSQAGLCPPNMDFEFGDFTNWVCRYGSVSAAGNVNTYVPTGIGQLPNRHTIISAATAGLDPYGGFPQICPNGSNYSVRLGNSSGGGQGESMSYRYDIPSTLSVFSLMFHYAVVFQDPNHLAWQQPRFRARITDLSTNSPIPCVTFDFTASASLQGFQQSPISPIVFYKGWTPVTMNLSAFIGRQIELEFITSDCTFNAHFGYAYIDVNTNCNGAITGTTICEGENAITLTAPYGFESYQWYSDNTFTTLLSTGQTLPLNPAPTVGTIIPVIVIPFPGFGCRDTLFATITVSPKPVSRAGPDAIICKGGQVQIGAPATVGHTYEWTPTSQVSNPTSSNPFAWNPSGAPQQFIVKTTDILTGCTSYDTTIVMNATVDTAIRATGNTSYCLGDAGPALSVNPASTAIQWFESSTAIAGANAATLLPTSSGSFWAQIIQGGCTDSTARITVTVNPVPQTSFTVNRDTACITNNNFQFTNTSTVSGSETMNHSWKFSDGVTLAGTDVTKIFNSTGTFTVQLFTVTASGCKDTAYGTVYVLPNGSPEFTHDSICTNRPVLFRNLSNENGSALVNYSWNFNNGDPPSLVRDPLPVSYSTPGQTDVVLQITTLGCELAPVSITRKVQVNKSDPGSRYRDITVPSGSSTFILAKDYPGGIYTWRPQVHLSSYNSRAAEFYALGDDVRYYIDVTDKHTCITTDTLLVQVLKKPGYYLPSGFTPNGDGLNDVARPYLVGMKSLRSFSIFNRWGDRIFYTTTYGQGWDGKFRNVGQNVGVYVWILEFYDADNKLVVEKGTIAIIK